MDNSLFDVLVIVGAVVISVISAISKARKKTAEREAAARADAEFQSKPDAEIQNRPDAETQGRPYISGIPIPNPWQELLNLPEEEDDFIPKNPETAPLAPSPTPTKKEREPLISRNIEYEQRNYIEEMAKAKAREREKKYSHSGLKNNLGAHELKVVHLDEEEKEYIPEIDLGLDEEDAWKKAVIYHDLLEPKF